jgi:hypothetical protein
MSEAKEVAKKGREVFKGHRQRGRRHLPPMLDISAPATLREFRKVAFPEFVWLLTMLSERPLRAGPVTKALDLGQAAFGRAQARGALDAEREPVFHGLLTDWERVPEPERSELLAQLRAAGVYEAIAPVALAHTLAVYPDAPGRWLIEPQLAAGLTASVVEAEKHLWELMRLGGTSHTKLAADAIYLWLRGLVMMKRISFSADDRVFLDILPRYEGALTEGERKMAESTLRALFLAVFHQRDETPTTLAWCQRFWRANKSLYECLSEPREPPDPPDLDKVKLGTERMERRRFRFLIAARDSDPDLFDSDRHDCLTGMTWRVLRIADHLVAHPAQWSEEHGYPAVREMFEAVVQMRYALSVEGERPAVWAEFKNYGRGRTKALKLHTEESLAKATGPEKAMLEGLLPRLTQAVNRDRNEEFQDISLAPTFIEGVSLQKMAVEVGMGDLHQSLSPASSALHGDWSALDDLFLDRCGHPLHGPHAIPRFEPAEESDERLPFLADTISRWALATYCAAVGYEPDASEEEEAADSNADGEPWEEPVSHRAQEEPGEGR